MTHKELLASLRMMTREEVMKLAMDLSKKGHSTPIWIQMDDYDDGDYFTAVLDAEEYPCEETTIAVWGVDSEDNVLHIKDYGTHWTAYTMPLQEVGD